MLVNIHISVFRWQANVTQLNVNISLDLIVNRSNTVLSHLSTYCSSRSQIALFVEFV